MNSAAKKNTKPPAGPNVTEELFESCDGFDWRISSAAVIFTVLFHLFLLMVLPSDFSSFAGAGAEKFDELEITILPPAADVEKFPEYIEANPYGNNLQPDDSARESFKDQRAADEIPDPASKSPLPYLEGESKDSQKIVSGNDAKETSIQEEIEAIENLRNRPLDQPSPPVPQETSAVSPAPVQPNIQAESGHKSQDAPKDSAAADKSAASESEKADSAAQAAQSPEGEKNASLQTQEDGDIPMQPAEKVDEAKSAKKTHSENIKEAKEPEEKAPASQSNDANIPEALPESALPPPRPRPVLDMKIPSGMIMDNRSRASMQGTISADSKFSEFGAYFQRMIEAISRQWNLLGNQYDLTSTYGTVVVIEYYIDSSGELTKIKTVFSNSTSLAAKLCEQSILSTAPYGVWSQEMVARFGDTEQSVTINFYYR